MPTQPDTGTVERRLEAIGLELPPSKPLAANYLGCKRSGGLLHVSGQIGLVRGAVGSDVTVEQGRLCARQAVLQMLRTVKDEIGDLDRIASVEKLLGFVRSAAGFTGQPKVVDGASNLLIALFGEAGRHSRTATGAPQLPFGAAVQLEMALRLRPAWRRRAAKALDGILRRAASVRQRTGTCAVHSG